MTVALDTRKKVRIHFNQNKGKFTIREQVPDRKNRLYWKNIALKYRLVLKEVAPHFYRGTQKRVQKGEIEKTPFHFLEGELLDPSEIKWANYKYQGELKFDPYRDHDYTWDSPLGKLIISPKGGLPSEALVYLSLDENSNPVRWVYLPR